VDASLHVPQGCAGVKESHLVDLKTVDGDVRMSEKDLLNGMLRGQIEVLDITP
jgi:hypothetical protein